ncbi:FAD-dependent monooxygenase [Fulvivirga kasyanovii]|uniref:FAD-dependent monooxygenase n=1 Tax=Fulvivirga kasyanovii TaxID=396812 RepID=A0ABW9RW77_9BACT|nr:NAD(P)/FAD-dependent oxidoreductase [Fulvivirga kasyanovii]MTI27483.1 FAD-dependent monooxygenase [Fulvivirga kasyanovii]
MKENITTPTENQEKGKFKTLIVGAGIAGLTLAALLEQRGERPVIIEKEDEHSFNHSGYMLGMLPLGGRVLNTLNLRQTYLEHSVSVHNYTLHNQKGEAVNSFPTDQITTEYGDYQGISRPEFMNILLSAVKSPIHFNTTVKSIYYSNKRPQVTFNDGSESAYDLVVIADGLHSSTRDLLLGRHEYKYYETRWGGWVTWIDAMPTLEGEYKEYWMPGKFMGLYPVKDKIGVFLGGDTKAITKIGPRKLAKQARKSLSKISPEASAALDAFDTSEEMFFWDFHDCRTKTWCKGNVALLGDAATGFLPTAGIGASMAMDSAAALDDELSRADHDHISYALKLYEERQKGRVEKAQSDSRFLGKLMFIKSPLLAALRDKVVGFYSMDMFLKGIKSVMEGK